MNYPNGHEFEFKMLRPSQIRADPLYQRELDPKRVDKIVRNFNGDTFNEPKVSYRDGVYWVFDGQHSIAAHRKIHNDKDKMLHCKVFKGMTWLEECEAFVRQNGIKKDPTTKEKLRAAYNASNPDVVDMVTKAQSCGFVVKFSATSDNPTHINATSALFRAYKAMAPDAFLDMMTAIKEAWFGDEGAVSLTIINGMAEFYKAYFGSFKRSDLVNALKKISPAAIKRRVDDSTNTRNKYGKEILKVYNARKSSNRLDDKL